MDPGRGLDRTSVGLRAARSWSPDVVTELRAKGLAKLLPCRGNAHNYVLGIERQPWKIRSLFGTLQSAFRCYTEMAARRRACLGVGR